MSYTRDHSFARVTTAALAGMLLGTTMLVLGCSSERQGAQDPAETSARHPAGSPAKQTSAESPKTPNQFALPNREVIEPKDERYGELVDPDDEEWVSADDKAWVRLSDEPGKHMERAREAMLRNDRPTAAAELQRAAAQIFLEADRATPKIAVDLRGAAWELERLARDVRQRKFEFAGELDQGMARAAHTLARHFAERARVAVKENHPRQAGHFLKSAANYLRKLKWDADYFRDAQLPQVMEDLGRETMLVAGKLMEGTGYTVDEVGKAIDKVGAAVEKFGEQMAAVESKVKPPPARKPLKAVCMLHPIGDSGVFGKVTFVDRGGEVKITAEVTGLQPGPHGFHIHEYGDCSAPDGGSAGGHYNPTAMPHAGPDSSKRHVGDLGNIVADDSGKADYKRTDHVIQLRGIYSIIGRAVIVHAGQDDLTSQPSGNAGARVACGVIGLANPAD